MTHELPTTFDAAASEPKWRAAWASAGCFEANPHSGKPPFSIVMPPPNVTGSLHMGHALVSTIQDVVCRWKRMSGFDVCWVPGTDHAGIATQTRVERMLLAEEGKRRGDLGREQFLARVWAWKEQYGSLITEQLRSLGCSCDWSRETFTLDRSCNHAVRSFFGRLYEEGLIYRGDRLVNWDPVTQTALADDEVDMVEREGSLWTIAYPAVHGEGEITVATSRPETLFGDVAIAVHPEDERYRSWVGKKVRVPVAGQVIAVIADERVEPDFGTGAVKITPAHDPLDWDIGQTHQLEVRNIMSPDGRLNEHAGKFCGLLMEEGRSRMVEALKEVEALRHVEHCRRRIGVSYRSKAVIEPYVSKQWFVRLSAFKGTLRSMVDTGTVKILPESWHSTYFHWIDNLRDWCISRQLWWGHRIPVWHHKQDPARMICWAQEGEPPEVLAAPEEWEQDPDVLDTWFSSALWPFSVFGWPQQTIDLERYYPNDLLITGWDILYFWVARMMMAGSFATHKPPFSKVFLHGLIYGKSYWRHDGAGGVRYVTEEERKAYDLGAKPPTDVHSRWEKMSKSLGNVIDPIEISAEYGTDAMRMALIATNAQSRQIDLDRRRFADARHFVNKVWNGARFVLLHLQGEDPLVWEDVEGGLSAETLQLEDRWILHRLDRVVQEVEQALECYAFDRMAQAAFSFFWDEFCSYYVEMAKPHLQKGTAAARKAKQKVLLTVLTTTLRLLHPVMPFITEELFARVGAPFREKQQADLTLLPASPVREALLTLHAPFCSVAPFPQVQGFMDPEVEAQFQLLQKVVHAIRNIRGEMQVHAGTAVVVCLQGDPKSSEAQLLIANEALLRSLVRVGEVTWVDTAPSEPHAVAVVGSLHVHVLLPAALLVQESQRLQKEVQRLQAAIEKSPALQAQFCARAPAALVAQHQAMLEQWRAELTGVQERLQELRLQV